MRRGDGAPAHRARGAGWRRIAAATRPVFGLAVITPLVFAGAVGATPRSPAAALRLGDARNTPVTPLAAVASTPDYSSGPAVVAVARPPSTFHVAGQTSSAPPPAMLVYSPGTLRIPAMALAAYRNAEQKMAVDSPECGISWNLLAGIGRIESMHANGGATDARGTAAQPIYGPVLDGSLPGNEVIVQSASTERVVYARAIGPMQFLPGTWARYASDGDGDGQADPQNLYDSTLAAARYLCSGGLNLREQSQVLSAVLRYNNSMPYARNVLGWAAAYTTGVVPMDLPPIVGPPPPLGDMHLEKPEGLGPDSPLNAHGLAPTDPMAHRPLIDLSGQPQTASQQQNNWSWLPAWLRPNQSSNSISTCGLICLEPQAGQPGQPAPPAAMPPYAVPPAAPMPPYAVPPAPPMPPYAVPPAAPMPPYAVPPAPPPAAAPAPMPPYAVPPPSPPA